VSVHEPGAPALAGSGRLAVSLVPGEGPWLEPPIAGVSRRCGVSQRLSLVFAECGPGVLATLACQLVDFGERVVRVDHGWLARAARRRPALGPASFQDSRSSSHCVATARVIACSSIAWVVGSSTTTAHAGACGEHGPGRATSRTCGSAYRRRVRRRTAHTHASTMTLAGNERRSSLAVVGGTV
jgi:hypothetical protein